MYGAPEGTRKLKSFEWLDCTNNKVLNVSTAQTVKLFVQSRHSKLCLCSGDIQNFIVCAVETFKTLLFVQSRIQNFIVCAVETFKTLLFVQSRHSKLYCLCSRDIQNFIVCAIATFKTLLFVQSSHSKLFSLRVPSGAPYSWTNIRLPKSRVQKSGEQRNSVQSARPNLEVRVKRSTRSELARGVLPYNLGGGVQLGSR